MKSRGPLHPIFGMLLTDNFFGHEISSTLGTTEARLPCRRQPLCCVLQCMPGAAAALPIFRLRFFMVYVLSWVYSHIRPVKEYETRKRGAE
jgi:hypothetical protein